MNFFGRIVPSRALITAVASLLFAGCESTPITIKQAIIAQGLAVNSDSSSIAGETVEFYRLNGSAPEETPLQTTTTADDGAFSVSFPRHQTYSNQFIVMLPNTPDFKMYGFPVDAQIKINMTSSALYELLKNYPAPITSYTTEEIKNFLTRAEEVIAAAVLDGKIIQTAPKKKLYKAYKNALGADNDFLAEIQLAALNNGYNLIGLIPYNKLNNVPSILSTTPKLNKPNIMEQARLVMSIFATDYNEDIVFYTWRLDDEIVFQTFESSGFTWAYRPTFETVPWYQSYATHSISVSVSDGGLVSTYTWNANVANIARAPIFSTVPSSTTSREESFWTYTPSAYSPDEAPVTINLNTAMTPVGMDMCVKNPDTVTTTPAYAMQLTLGTCTSEGGVTTCSTPAANRVPCTEADLYKISWTPTNCDSLAPQNIQLKAFDPMGTTGYQTFAVTVAEVNEVTTGQSSIQITSTPPTRGPIAPYETAHTSDPQPRAMENQPWTYQVKVFDEQADPTLLPLAVDGNNPPINGAYIFTPGGTRCPDIITFSLTTKPTGASIDPSTGIITWTPSDSATGVQRFVVLASDGHRHSATQEFFVRTQNVERAPYFSNAPAEGSTIQVDSETYLPGTPYTLNIYGTDPDASDSSTANKLAVTVDVTQITGMPEPPAPPTAPANPFSAGSSAVTGEATRWTADWAINDSHTPVKYAVHATVCDHNPSNHPVEDYAYYFVTYNPAIISLIPGTVAPFQYDHFCIERNFTVHAPKRNYTPVITSTAGAIGKGNMSGLPEQKYVYDITVTDDNTTPADTLSFALITAPAGMTITTLDNTGPSASAKIEWKPNNSTQLGINNVKLRVSDSNSYPGGAHFVEQSFQIFVTEYNLAPVITRPVREVATNGVEYALTPNATDPNITSPYNRLKYYLDSAPTGMTIDVNTGKIKWTPSVAQAKLGTADVTLRVEDQAPTIPVNERLSDTKTFTITLNYVNRAPVFVDIPPQTIPLHMEYVLNILTTDEDGDTFTMTSGALPSGAVFTDNGDGTATFTWTPTTEETVTITASILDSAGNSASQDIEITTVNKPVFRSHPVTSANSNGTYTYELNALDPAGEGLTYTIETGPSGMSISGNTVTWTPNPSQVGNQQVIIKAIDGNDHEGVQEYNITVLSTPNTAPVASTILPDNAQTVIATEGKELTLTVAGTDSETDPLHYTWYKHNGTAYAWSDDTNGTFKLTPTDTDNGDTSVRCDITDGATITQVVFNIHIRNSIPVMPTAGTGLYSYSSGGPVLQVVESERAGKISVLRGGASPRLEIFNTANISTGAAAFASGFAFTPARMTVRNTYADTSLLMVYFAKNGEITNLAGQDYFSVGSDSMSIGSVNATTGFQSSFNNSYEFSGGTNEAFKVTGSIKRFNIKPTDRTKLMSAISGTEQAEVALPSAGKALVYDSADDKLFVALASTDQILVMNPNTLAVTATINLPAGASPSLLYINTTSRKLYVYNAGNGTLTEINAQSNAIGTTVENLPTMTVSNDPASLIAGDDADNIVYLIDPSGGKLYTIDAVYNTFRSLDVTGLVNINFSPITKRLLGATNNKLFFLK